MKRRKLIIACMVGVLAFAAVIAFALLSSRKDVEGRYDQLLRARRLEARFTRWSSTGAYRLAVGVTRSDPAGHFRNQANKLESSLCKAGALVWLNFYGYALHPQLVGQRGLGSWNEIPQAGKTSFVPAEAPRQSGAQWVRWGVDDRRQQIRVLCRPQDAGFWRSANCCITNRVQWGALIKFIDDPDFISCRLPDGSIVDLGVGQRWLNQSIAEGWMVGFELLQEPSVDSRVVLSRRKPGGKTE